MRARWVDDRLTGSYGITEAVKSLDYAPRGATQA
jgi:hypothetical protein